MKAVAKFEKVTYEQFNEDYKKIFMKDFDIKEYENLGLPKRATKGSAGYDFFMPFDLSISPNNSIIIPTGIRCKIDDSYVLKIYPRSSLGFKYFMALANTVGIIDADYYNAKNQGHIMIKVTNRSEQSLLLKKENAFCQGIFLEYFITYDDECETIRTGGIGSTSN